LFQSLRQQSYDHHSAIYFLLLERLRQHRPEGRGPAVAVRMLSTDSSTCRRAPRRPSSIAEHAMRKMVPVASADANAVFAQLPAAACKPALKICVSLHTILRCLIYTNSKNPSVIFKVEFLKGQNGSLRDLLMVVLLKLVRLTKAWPTWTVIGMGTSLAAHSALTAPPSTLEFCLHFPQNEAIGSGLLLEAQVPASSSALICHK